VVQSELSPRSSVEKSIGFLNRVSEVRFLPGAPDFRSRDHPAIRLRPAVENSTP
jgi:hypothetical protein